MKTKLIVLLFLFTTSIIAEEQSPRVAAQSNYTNPYDASESSVREGFPYLSFLESSETYLRALVGYNRKTTTIINTKRSALPKSHPLYVADEFEADDVLLMDTTLGNDGKRYFVLFSAGASADPEFYLIDPHEPEKYWAELPGNALVMPGNGTAYVAGRYNEMFTRRNKYLYLTSGMSEVKQPFAYVGLKSRTLSPVTIYTDPDEKREIAKLPLGTEVEVLLADERVERPQKICLLLKTPFGLIGWAWVSYGQYTATEIDGISFHGD